MKKDKEIFPFSNVINEFWEQHKQQAEREKQIISNYDYISWLENFTQTYPNFTDESWLYEREKLSESDYKNVENLPTFFNGIRSYYHHFHINTEYVDAFETNRIHIIHNNIGYQLGLVCGQGAYVYVVREMPHEKAIHFYNVVNYIVPEDFETKKELLEKFERVVSAMKEADIPSETMLDIVKKYYKP